MYIGGIRPIAEKQRQKRPIPDRKSSDKIFDAASGTTFRIRKQAIFNFSLKNSL
jgi:hypothetical protein